MLDLRLDALELQTVDKWTKSGWGVAQEEAAMVIELLKLQSGGLADDIVVVCGFVDVERKLWQLEHSAHTDSNANKG